MDNLKLHLLVDAIGKMLKQRVLTLEEYNELVDAAMSLLNFDDNDLLRAIDSNWGPDMIEEDKIDEN